MGNQQRHYFGLFLVKISLLCLCLLLSGCSTVAYCPSCTPLLEKIASGKEDEAEKHVRAKEYIHEADRDGNTPLHWASRESQVKVAELLLDGGVDINAVNHSGETALHQAVFWGKPETVKLLIDKGANVNAVIPNGSTPLTSACARNFHEKAALLIDNGADANLADGRGDVPLASAAQHQDAKNVRLLLSKGASANARGAGQVPLVVAADAGNVDVAELLLAHGADANAADDKGYTSLMAASRKGSEKMARFLVAKGATVETKNEIGMTPLLYASQSKQKEIVFFLVKQGANVHAEDKNGLTPLYAAALNDDRETMSYLIDAGGTQPKLFDGSIEESFASGILLDTFGKHYQSKGDKARSVASYAKAKDFFQSAAKGYSDRADQAGGELNKVRGANVANILFSSVMLATIGAANVYGLHSTDDLKKRRDYLDGRARQSKENVEKLGVVTECLEGAQTLEAIRDCPM